MSLTLGRFATTEDPQAGTLRQRGDDLQFDSMIVASSVDEFKARMQQLRGLMDNPDEPVVPFTWTEDSHLDGFYGDIEVEIEDTAAMYASYNTPFSLRMRRVAGGFAKPRFETIVTSVLRFNSHGVTTPNGLLGCVPSPLDVDASLLSAVASSTITTEDGSVSRYTFTSFAAGTVSWRAFADPADYYDGAARIEVKYGSTWYPIHGQHVPSSLTSDWRLSNGYCRVYPSAVSGNGRFTVETYRSGSWVGREFTGYQVDDAGGGSTGATSWATGLPSGAGYRSPIIRRNSPETCVVSIFSGKFRTTFTLHAGSPYVQVSIANDDYAAATDLLRPGFIPSASVASTTFTGGIRATANDANGLRYLISCPAATTAVSLVTGGVVLTTDVAASSWQITADYENGTFSDTAFRDLFFAGTSYRRRVVAR